AGRTERTRTVRAPHWKGRRSGRRSTPNPGTDAIKADEMNRRIGERRKRRTCGFRANDTGFNDSLGQRPRNSTYTICEALKARFNIQMSRAFSASAFSFIDRGALPQASLTRAPFALKRSRRILLFLACVLALGLAAFAQDDEEDETSNAKPDVG